LVRLATDTGLRGSTLINALWVVALVFAFSWVFDLQLHRLVLRLTRRRPHVSA
jgi:hypothetical protein